MRHAYIVLYLACQLSAVVVAQSSTKPPTSSSKPQPTTTTLLKVVNPETSAAASFGFTIDTCEIAADGSALVVGGTTGPHLPGGQLPRVVLSKANQWAEESSEKSDEDGYCTTIDPHALNVRDGDRITVSLRAIPFVETLPRQTCTLELVEHVRICRVP
jgi:hypothetical protein